MAETSAQFEPFSGQGWHNPYDVNARLRSEAPVYRVHTPDSLSFKIKSPKRAFPESLFVRRHGSLPFVAAT